MGQLQIAHAKRHRSRNCRRSPRTCAPPGPARLAAGSAAPQVAPRRRATRTGACTCHRCHSGGPSSAALASPPPSRRASASRSASAWRNQLSRRSSSPRAASSGRTSGPPAGRRGCRPTRASSRARRRGHRAIRRPRRYPTTCAVRARRASSATSTHRLRSVPAARCDAARRPCRARAIGTATSVIAAAGDAPAPVSPQPSPHCECRAMGRGGSRGARSTAEDSSWPTLPSFSSSAVDGCGLGLSGHAGALVLALVQWRRASALPSEAGMAI